MAFAIVSDIEGGLSKGLCFGYSLQTKKGFKKGNENDDEED